ncbi:MAG: hypothetical protein A2X94_08010 [Bdellovibrionales bacterium GWB1_55_8]|nr:MAG: hypothetical protein A2X94_08010 [Bdellovibrionales bacterium GWB1_55_8]
MRKIALICRQRPSDWVSCRSITQNLINSYSLEFPSAEIRQFYMEESASFLDLDQLAEGIVSFKPDLIAIVDHKPHPAVLFELLARKLKSWPRLVIHAFGDFTINPNEWLRMEELFRSAQPVFVGASEKQQKLLRSFISGRVAWVPFPVDSSLFSFREGAYSGLRKEQGISTSETILLYSGRLSLQKNVLLLMRAFAAYLRFNPQARLWLAGPIDDLGIPYIGKTPLTGLLAADLIELRDTLVADPDRERVQYLGDLEAARLADLYAMADVFVSFSTHNDEDFGMAPAEAWCCGQQLLLSDWGGYSSFGGQRPGSVDHIPVQISGRRIQPELKACIKGMASMASRNRTDADRRNVSEGAREFCSCESVGRKIGDMVRNGSDSREPFSGFTQAFEQLARAYRLNAKAPFRAAEGYSNLYRELYDSYF